ncbi:3,4-dihydroxy-2-butanone-4-phosphate synthase [Curtobacterium sp. S6]|uniref:3,4-dihydroxy-2-butanone-4-phosphate synthase n=1 Tax=Curtobacterium sp. S6 TaxID=1479623 RepID=UPI0004AABDD4|nr:3,4-dihydroxy-2-butanone-4-phosphate synthase [Curtobacterium sp. S6]
MFTGIIESLGTVEHLDLRADSAVLSVRAGDLVADLADGGSLAINGVCLTATPNREEPGLFTADVIGETLARTTLKTLHPGSRVNLERCLRADGRFDGHIVQGHVDGTGKILAIEDLPDWSIVRIAVPRDLAPYLAEKGSIAVDGISLTVTAVSAADEAQPWFEVGIIPTTLRATTLGAAHAGDPVNLETDAVAKYLARAREFDVITGEPEAIGLAVEPTVTVEDSGKGLDTVDDAVRAIRAGGLAVVVDDEDRENEGDLIGAAALADPARLGFMVRHSSGVVCAPMTPERADALDLPPMTNVNEDPKATAYTVTCDAAHGITSGISASDRARTLNVLAGSSSTPAELTRPGHILPLRAVSGGVRERQGHTEAAVDLARLAGLPEVGYIAEVVHDDGSMMRFEALREFATTHGLPMISIADLQEVLEEAAEEERTA